MKTLKEFLNTIQTQLNEAVPEHLRSIPATWNHHGAISDETKGKITSALGPRGFKMFPLDNTEPDIDPDVAEHLTKHNWQVTDYAKGMASKKTQVGAPERGIPLREKIVHKAIGGILNETNAPDHVKRAFENDPARTGSNTDKSKLSVLVTTTPHGLASGTVGTSFDKSTCMNIADGCNRHYMPHESAHATHAAMLVSSDDKGAIEHGEPDHVIAREFWKQHSSKDNDDIFRPESKRYGSSNSAFENTSAKLATELYPAKIGEEYTKHNALYDDSGINSYKVKSKDEIENAVNNGSDIVDNTGSSVDKELIDHALNHFNKNKDTLSDTAKKHFVMQMSRIGNLNSQHVAALHKIATTHGNSLTELIKNHGDKLSSSAIKDVLSDMGTRNLPSRLLMNPKLSQDTIDKLEPSDYTFVRKSLLKPHHYQKAVDYFLSGRSRRGKEITDNAGHFTKEQLTALSNHPYKNVIQNTIMNEPNFDKSHHDTLIKNTEEHLKSDILSTSKFASINDIKDKSDIIQSFNIRALLSNPNLTAKDQKSIKDDLVNNKNSTTEGQLYIPDHISKHLTPDDHKKLAKSKGNLLFESVPHTEKHIGEILNNINETDNIISEFDKKEKRKDSNYNPEDNDTHKKLKDILLGHIKKYAQALDDHTDIHDTVIAKKDIENNLDELNKLKNYNINEADKEHHRVSTRGVRRKLSFM